MSFDPAAFRRESAERWERAAQGWAAHRAAFQAAAAPVSTWMVEATDPRPGHRVLELAAGTAETGLMAAQRIRPGGTLIATDVAEAMLAAARARAGELGLDNVEFRAMDAEWIDLPAADVDAVLCRFGIMLLADPAACAREVRRVLRPGGRLALATWTARDENPWAVVADDELIGLGVMSPPAEDGPGQFSLSDPAKLEELLLDAGFVHVEIDQVSLTFSFADLDAWWDQMLDMSISLRDAVAALTPQQRDDLRGVVDARLAGYVGADGRVALPGRANAAVAEA
ncbi:MAG TPA: methyltransferase domain-containing protein [Solirubrobacteraceae bacterium]|nr:methyltransferase domain-containing protein [Solirubrobacteraceae bacterium]